VAIGARDAETGKGIGVARFVRLERHPETAEAAVAIVDDWQGRGLGRVLLERLAERAHGQGIRRFRASLFTHNRDMLYLFGRVGTVRVTDRSGDTLEIDVDLTPAAALAPHRLS
jgi:GNAT superfamily N-acetyltransferase